MTLRAASDARYTASDADVGRLVGPAERDGAHRPGLGLLPGPAEPLDQLVDHLVEQGGAGHAGADGVDVMFQRASWAAEILVMAMTAPLLPA